MMGETDPLTELDMVVITITEDADGLVSLDSDVDAGETLLLMERAKHMLVFPEFWEAPDDDED